MGAYVSVEGCKAHYNVTLECYSNLTDPIPTVGGYGIAEVHPDPDIAGVGIVYVFIGVTSFALALSIIHVIWTIAKFIGLKRQYSSEEKKLHRRCGNISISKVCEALVMSCSDQQLFTGGAYAIALRYYKGCEIVAYHYNIVSNMMLLTCATHLMSVTITENYFEYPELGLIRMIVVTGAFLVAGILLTNQNADTGLQFPTKVPLYDDKNSGYMFLPAACFQQGSPSAETVKKSFSAEGSRSAFLFSDVGNHIQGWNWYLIILLFYGAAVIVGLFRFFQRGFKTAGKRARILRRTSTMIHFNPDNQHRAARAVFKGIYILYLLGGIGISAAAVVISSQYILSLRSWAKDSHWLEDNGGGQSEEDDATSVGQLVPIFLSLLTLFSFAQTISQMREKHDRTSVVYEPAPSNLTLSPKKAHFDNVETRPIPTPSDLDSHFQFNVGQGSPPMVSPTHMSMPEGYIATPVSNLNGQGTNYVPVMPIILAPSSPPPQQGWQGSHPA